MSRLLLSLVIVSVALAGCPARRDGLSRDALERSLQRGRDGEPLPDVVDLLRWRVPLAPSTPTTVVGRAAEQAFLRGDDVRAGDDDTELLRCLRADAQRDYAAIAEHCGTALTTQPGDLRGAIVVGLLRRHLTSLSDDDSARLAAATAHAVSACRSVREAPCAWLTAAAMRFSAAAREQLDMPVVDDDSVRRVEADGPFAAVHFRDDANAEAERIAHPRRSTRTLEARGARVYPADRGGRGWYRLVSEATVASSGPAHVFVTGGGAGQIVVDGVVVHTRASGRFSADIEWVPLDLAAGRHRLDVLAYDDGDGLAVAVLDDAGRSVWQPADAVTTAPTAASKRRDDRGWQTALLLPATVDSGDAHAFVTLVLRHHAARAGLGSDDELAALTTTMVQAFGWSPIGAILAAQAVEADALPERFAAGLAAPLWSAAHARWPTSPLPLLAQARATRAEAPDAALGAYRKLVEVAPAYPQGRRELLPLLLEQGLVDEANAVARDLLALGHTSENIEAALPALRAAGHLREAATLVEQRAARAPDRRWRQLLRRGETDAAREVLATLVDEEGDTGREALEALTQLDEVQHPDTALARLRPQLVKVSPGEHERLRLQMAKIAASMTGEADALQTLPTTTSLEGLNVASALGAPPPWATHLAEGDRVIGERRRGAPPFAQWPLVFLHSANEHHYTDDGSALVIRHWLVEVRTKQAIDSIGELKTDDGELLVRLRVHKPDGTTLEPEHHHNIDAISLTGLAPGDVVEWLSVSVDHNGVGGGALQQQQLPSYAAASWRFVVSAPEALTRSRRFRVDRFNGAPAPLVATTNGRTTTTFAATMVPARRPEPLAVDADEEQPTIVVSLDFDDTIVRRLRAPALMAHADRDTWLRRVAQHVAQRGSDDDKLRRIFRFVAERITEADGSPDALATLATGRGQRLPLLLALLRVADLRVTPLAVHSAFDGPLDRPTVGAFPTLALAVQTSTTHVVASVGEAVVLDRLPTSMSGAATLDLEHGTRDVLPASAIDPDAVDVRIDVQLADDASTLKGLVAVKVPTVLADQLRGGIRQATPEQLAHFIEAGLAASMPGVVASNVVTPDLDAIAQPLTFVADIAVDVDPNTVRFEHMFSQGAAAAFRAAFPLGLLVQVAERETSLRARPQREQLEFVVHLPPSASFVDVPPTVRLVAGPVTLEQRSAVNDGVLVWERTLAVQSSTVTPASWPEVRASLAPLLAAADARLGFVHAQPAGGASR